MEHMSWTAFWVLFFAAWFFAGWAYLADKKRQGR